jgi:hypothetical protein
MIYSGNWNDEIDVDGFFILEESYVSDMKKFLKNFHYTIWVDIGFNDTVEYEDGKELLQEISFNKITNKEAEIIQKHFGPYNDFGANLLTSIKESSLKNGDDVFIPFENAE